MIALTLLGTACQGSAPRDYKSDDFPAASRPVSAIVSSRWSTEEARDRLNEANDVMKRAGIAQGMTVADIGAGEGYYTIRLANAVGEKGRVLAQDVIPEVRDKLAERVTREELDNVSVKLGEVADPMLPENSFDRIFMVHMYHEIAAPYEFLWRLRPALKPDGEVIVVDADRPTNQHGTPHALLECEFKAIGYQLVERQRMPAVSGYLARFRAVGPRPEPKDIKVCPA